MTSRVFPPLTESVTLQTLRCYLKLRSTYSIFDAGFCSGIENVILESHTKEFFDAFSSYFQEICGLACNHRVRLESSFIASAMALKVLEGIASQLDPETDVCGMSIAVLFKAHNL